MTTTNDDGFHEIQLNGKQLVFLFMIATVVSVVIFLCGVMVGRGVRDQRGETVVATGPGPGVPVDDTAPAAAAPAATAPASQNQTPSPAATATPPESPGDDDPEDYYKQLTAEKPPAETAVKPSADKSPAARTSPPPEPPPSRAPASASAPAAIASGGFAVQVVALRDRSEADAIVKRLASKGYQAYVLNPLPGKPPVYRVQVGRFQVKADAERTASRLKKEEQFSPWVIR